MMEAFVLLGGLSLFLYGDGGVGLARPRLIEVGTTYSSPYSTGGRRKVRVLAATCPTKLANTPIYL